MVAKTFVFLQLDDYTVNVELHASSGYLLGRKILQVWTVPAAWRHYHIKVIGRRDLRSKGVVEGDGYFPNF